MTGAWRVNLIADSAPVLSSLPQPPAPPLD